MAPKTKYAEGIWDMIGKLGKESGEVAHRPKFRVPKFSQTPQNFPELLGI